MKRDHVARLLGYAVLCVPVHLLVQYDLIWTLFEHPTGVLVRGFGITTLAFHWLLVMLAFALVAALVPHRKSGFVVLFVLTCIASIYAQVDWICYRNFHVHAIGFVLAGLLSQEQALANSGIKPVMFVLPGVFAAASVVLLWLVARWITRRPAPRWAHAIAARPALALAGLAAVFLADRGTYTLYQRRTNQRIAEFTESIPAYLLPPTRSVVARFVPRQQALIEVTARIHAGTPPRAAPLVYPRHIATSAPTRRPDIVFLCYESLRRTAVDANTMPVLTKLAAESSDFVNHYSNSTATHFGLFSLFYGLYPAAWWQLAESRDPPAPVTILRDHGYRTVAISTSPFSWYRMNDFLFTRQGFDRVDDSRNVALREIDKGKGWTADTEAVDATLAELRDHEEPVFAFLFLYSTHFHYYYPDDCEVEKPVYDPDSVSTMDFPANADRVRHRYHNALRFGDRLLKRLLDGIDLANTILVITGDHGEEHGEHGFFFHAGDFVDEQCHVPMVVCMPGREPRVISNLTSHVDVMPTLLDELGIRIESPGFAWTGRNMFGPTKPWILLGAANVNSPMPTRFAMIDDHTKFFFEVIAGSLRVTDVLTKDDAKVGDPLTYPELGSAIRHAKQILRENPFH